MKIIKFKKISKDKYKLYLDNGEIITLYEDIILKNDLLLTKQINDDLLKKIDKENNEMHTYSMALNFLSIRMRSEKEIYNYLLKKQVQESAIKTTIERLIKDGYINDYNFAKAYLTDQLMLTNNGPYKIKNNLVELGIKQEYISEILEGIDKEVINQKLQKLIDKKIKTSKGSLNIIKIKLLNYFYNLGYDKNDILAALETMNKKVDISYLQKEYDKLYIKYSKKYSNNELKYLIEQKLYSKGYSKEDLSKIKREN